MEETTSKKPEAHRLKSLDSIRGIAALIVLFGHCFLLIPEKYGQVIFDKIGTSPFPINFLYLVIIKIFTAERFAVILFFVLSGFVLALSIIKNKPHYKEFILKRFFRIYPILFISIITSYLLHIFIGYTETTAFSSWYKSSFQSPITNSFENLIGHLFLTGLYAKHIYLDGSMWSLIYEVRISIIFPILVAICLKINMAIVFIASLLLSLASTYFIWNNTGIVAKGLYTDTALSSLITTGYFIIFFIMGIYLANKKQQINKAINQSTLTTKILLLLLFFLCAFYYDSWLTDFHAILSDYLNAIGACIIIALAIGWRKFSKLLLLPPLLWLGKISYSLYLIHSVIIYAVCELFGSTLPLWEIITIIISMSLLCAELMARFIEYPFINLGKKIITKPNS